jgi:cystathionine beta-lyase/cystathionine gamma-synthase
MDTKLIHHPKVNPYITGEPLVSPIHQSVKYVPKNMEELRSILVSRDNGFIYSRVSNPTVRELELTLAALQGAEDGICTATGIAAIATVAMSYLEAGDHVVVLRESYKPTRILLRQILSRFGVVTHILGLDELDRIKDILAKHKPKLFFVESPTNPVLRIPDLRLLRSLCSEVGTLLVLDNTFAGLHLHKGLADIFVHSLTKFANGHSDAMGGGIFASKAHIEKMMMFAVTIGATLDPHAAWLIQRGLKTYFLRVERATQNAFEIAKWLSSNAPNVSRIFYPALPDHPDHGVWLKQMNGEGGAVVSFELASGKQSIDQFIDRLKIFSLTPSMGCIESLVAPSALLFADDYSEEEARSAGITPLTVRLAVGLENVKDLIADLEQALT